MTADTRGFHPAQATLGRAGSPAAEPPSAPPRGAASPELGRVLAEVKGQAQFLLYLADQIEESIQHLASESDPGHASFLCKLLGMYASQLESKHQGLGDKIAETCQEVYVAIREFELENEP
jgi:hypothetical protein